jgi:hypothetical protein
VTACMGGERASVGAPLYLSTAACRSFGFLSGWYFSNAFRYAFLISSLVALGGTAKRVNRLVARPLGCLLGHPPQARVG